MNGIALDVAHMLAGGMVLLSFLLLYQDRMYALLNVFALHAVCAHAGGPLAQGTVVDGCIQCPWHGSRFRMSDGHVRRGPAVYDQPSYEIRGAEGGGYEVRRAVAK